MFQKQRPGWWDWLGLALVGLLLWPLAAHPAPASAHALLIRSIPEANAQLSQPPATIEMWFSEPLEASFSSARLLNSTGQEVPTGSTSIDPTDPTHMTLPLGQLEPGIYTVAWQTLSQTDGHEFYGSFPLTILNPDGSRSTADTTISQEQARSDWPFLGEIIARWLALLGGILFLGAPLFYIWVVRAGQPAAAEVHPALIDNTRTLVVKAIGAATFAIVLGSWLQIILLTLRLGELNGLPNLLLGTRTGVLGLARQMLVLTGLLLALWRWPLAQLNRDQEPPFWLEVAAYQFVVLVLLIGAALKGEWLVAVSAIIISAVGLILLIRAPHPAAGTETSTRTLLLFLAAMLLLSFSLGSHAGAAPGWVWAVLGDYLHLLAAAAWIGGLVLLPLLIWRVLRASSPLSPVLFWPAVQRFSRLAALAVFILSTTGFFNSLVQLPSLSSLLETTYGWVLLLKLGLTALVLILALLNHRLVHSRAHPLQTAEAWPRFQRQVMLESMLGLGLMVSVAVLVQTPTPASFGGNNPPSGQLFEQITQADDLTIHTQVLPNQVGQNLFLVHLYHQDNSPVGEVQLVRLFFNYQETQLGQAQANMALWQDNFFRLEGAFLNQAGQWNLSIYVRRRGMDDILTDVTLEVPPAAGQITNASPWQNPIPGWPVEVVIAGVVGAMGGSVFLWGWLRRR